jgi:adenylate kinase
MRIVLLGPPGSGKGTQGDLVTRKYGFPRISTGDLLRAAVQEKTPVGLKAKAVMDSGELVSDEIVIALVDERIRREDCRGGYVLDGFPRTVVQAEALSSMDPERPEVAVDIRVEENDVVDRLSARRICGVCGAVFNLKLSAGSPSCTECGGPLVQRSDDTQETIRERLRVYRELTEPLIGYYREKGRYFAVDGAREIEAVFADVAAILDGTMDSSGKGQRIS